MGAGVTAERSRTEEELAGAGVAAVTWELVVDG